jgi:hypothetical protein
MIVTMNAGRSHPTALAEAITPKVVILVIRSGSSVRGEEGASMQKMCGGDNCGKIDNGEAPFELKSQTKA